MLKIISRNNKAWILIPQVEVPKIEVTPAQEESIRNYINSYIMKGRPISSKVGGGGLHCFRHHITR